MNTYPLSTIRHSTAHVMAQAVQILFPQAKLAIGPSIDNGFYYDFDLDTPFSEEDLKKIESVMENIIAEKQPFNQYNLNNALAKEHFQDSNQCYKLELIKDLNLPHYSFFKNGPFIDLCKGPHVDHTGSIGAFKLIKVSGAYWRGNEKNKMLQRIYGTAFDTKKNLRVYLTRLDEAKKRDHRVLGKQLDLFSLSDDIGGGLVLWHPNGSRIRHAIETLWKDAHFKSGYDLLYSPHVGKESLWKTSGHIDFYQDNMFPAIDIESSKYFTKPMNCPFHIMTYKSKKRSYRNLPIKYAELGTVYRYERSGVLHGLMRVRGFTQDDAHIFCTEEQIEAEVIGVIKFCLDMLKTFGFEKYDLFLSTRPKEKYVGSLLQWEKAEQALESALKKTGLSFEVDAGGGAFYGPKIDIKIEDALERKWQCSTIQFDFNLPERFAIQYTGHDGQPHQPYMIHRALLGSIERFFGILIEHYAGKFPVWISPVQVKIIAIKSTTHAYCKVIEKHLSTLGARVSSDLSNEKLGYKIRVGREERVPFMIIIGDKEVDNNVLAIRSRDNGELGKMTLDQFTNLLKPLLDAGKNALYSEPSI